MNTVEIKSDNYSVYIGDEVLQEFNCILEDYQDQYSKIFIFCDENSFKHCLPYLVEQVPMLIGAELIEIESGELNKTILICNDVWKTMSESNADRNAIFINLGGGVVCDMGGVIASLYKRGIRFFHIPTTLLSQVDASVGGKTGVNNSYGKNLVGSFYQPSAVICDTAFLSTLNEKEMSAGLAEIIKYGLIHDTKFLSWLNDNIQNILKKDRAALGHAIQRSCQIKAEIVSADEKEQSIRAILNFGHTFGHAIELQTGYTEWSHGEAVAAGMVLASQLSAKMSLISKEEVEMVKELITAADLPIEPPNINANDFITAMKSDKKVKERKIQLVLLKKIGEAFLTSEYSEEDLLDVLGAD